MIHTFSEPTVAVSGTSIKSSGILKDLMLNLTATKEYEVCEVVREG